MGFALSRNLFYFDFFVAAAEFQLGQSVDDRVS